MGELFQFIVEADPQRIRNALRAAEADLRKARTRREVAMAVTGLVGYLSGVIDGAFQHMEEPTGIQDAYMQLAATLMRKLEA